MNFKTVSSNFRRGLYSGDDVALFCRKGRITPDEYRAIVGEEYIPARPKPVSQMWDAAVTARLEAFATQPFSDGTVPFSSLQEARMAVNSTEYRLYGEAANRAYDATWKAADALLPQIESGALSIEAALLQLPALSWGL